MTTYGALNIISEFLIGRKIDLISVYLVDIFAVVYLYGRGDKSLPS